MKTTESPTLISAEGIVEHSSGDYEERIKIYTAAIICLNRRVSATMDGGGVMIEGERIATEIKAMQFRLLSRRSEASLALKNYEKAYTDANAALALYPHPNSVEDFTTLSSAPTPSDIELAHDLVNRAMAGVLGFDDHLHLDNIRRTKAKYILENPQGPVKFVPVGCEAIPQNAELQLENTQDDLSVLTPSTGFPASEWTMGTTETSSLQRLRLDVIDENPKIGSPSSQQCCSMTDDQRIPWEVGMDRCWTSGTWLPVSARNMGTTDTNSTSRRLRLDTNDENPKNGSLSSQQCCSMTSHQRIPWEVGMSRCWTG